MNSNKWTTELLSEHIHNFGTFTNEERIAIEEKLNSSFTPSEFSESVDKLDSALNNNKNQSSILKTGKQIYPETAKLSNDSSTTQIIEEFAIVLMAGGEGERLRLSLLENGYSPKDLENFTKATFPLPGFPEGFGALQTNLVVISSLCRKYNTDIPVIITTGPEESTTADIIPQIVKKANNFGLKNLKIIAQNERLHLSIDKKIVIRKDDTGLTVATNPDETGGPIMKLKEKDSVGQSTLGWISSLNKSKIMVLQATALYDPSLIETMAAAAKEYDGLGIGIARDTFKEKDPYGTFVLLEENATQSLKIIEQAIRNDETRLLKNSDGKYLPFNTGFYIFNASILEQCDLPDYATPPKEVHPDLEKAPKVGYAATDIISFAQKPAVLTISPESFAVIKDASDPQKLSALGKKYGLQTLCENYLKENG